MKALEEQDHYEVLDVKRGADATEIERAYRMLQSTYESDSLALYSVFEEADAGALRERIEAAYHVLSDEQARRAYDEETADLGPELEQMMHAQYRDAQHAPGPPEPLVVRDFTASPAAETTPGVLGGGIEGLQDLEGDADEEGQDFDGPALRRARLRRGIEIDQIASVTKVSPAYLRCIEEDTYDELPAPVYVRGFLNAYARAIGLDPEKVAVSYMARLQESKVSRRKSRLLGRK